jgi:hypothetical protein
MYLIELIKVQYTYEITNTESVRSKEGRNPIHQESNYTIVYVRPAKGDLNQLFLWFSYVSPRSRFRFYHDH